MIAAAGAAAEAVYDDGCCVLHVKIDLGVVQLSEDV